MPRFHFHLRARGMVHRDLDGIELPDAAAAWEHAVGVKQELTRNSGIGARHWSMVVENENGELQFDLFFADGDPSLATYSPQVRLLVMETCRRLGALTDALTDVRATVMEARMLIARSRGKPQLVYSRGE